MILTVFTLVHVLISLVGIFSGFVVLFHLVNGRNLARGTAVFLATTVATSVTGFFFPVHHFMPSHAVGLISLVLLGLAIYALYSRHLAGGWRKTYVITAVMALYLNVFVGIVQSFLKIPALKALAPTQAELPFKIAQLTCLVLFVALGVLAAIRFREVPAAQLPS
ncbi:MAG: hypothetical protein WDN28_06195 [Chthoniobacter sp.]